MATGKNSGGATGKNIQGGGGIDRNAVGDISIVNGSLIVTTRGGQLKDLGKTVVQELITESLTVPVGDGEVEIAHDLNTKSIMYQVFDSADNAVEVPPIRELNKIKFFFGTTDTEATYTVVIAN